MLHERLLYIILLYIILRSIVRLFRAFAYIYAYYSYIHNIMQRVQDDQILCDVEVRHVRTWPSDVEYS